MLSTAAGANVVYARKPKSGLRRISASMVPKSQRPQGGQKTERKKKWRKKKKLCGLYPFHIRIKKYAVFTLPK